MYTYLNLHSRSQKLHRQYFVHIVTYFPYTVTERGFLKKYVNAAPIILTEQLEIPFTEDLFYKIHRGIKKLPPQDNPVTLILLSILFEKIFALFKRNPG